MELVQRLGLTRNEGLYFVFSSAKFCAEKEDVARRELDNDALRNTWVGRGVGLNIQDILNNVACESTYVAGCSEEGLGQDYIDRVRQQITVARA